MTEKSIKYTREIAEEICDKIATGSKGLLALCKDNPHWPGRSTILLWRSKIPEFREMYYQAKRDQIEGFIDEVIAISDDKEGDTEIDGDGKVTLNFPNVQRARLMVDTRKWVAAKLYPRIYGDKLIPDDKTQPKPEDLLKELA